ncbi:GNAT family N-acetyltransferase [Parendozoicomonas haliclonae]|uniref:Putative acetyltransferase n=1 Tax=Parendozoicomonas haliclonae TaxID=1960125 RepID=A0A1X7AMS3_9GAMM|nr:GNAT family N-acetyltransferase [Parendozoicomonas haliclonae]SMA47596.1 putative acetyltransferase [Parendozoicomonas haliclonae]
MITELNISDETLARETLRVSLAAYTVEADLIGYSQIPPLRETLKDLMAGTGRFYGSYRDNKLVAVIEINEENSEKWISRLVVDPGYFHQGIATQLIRYCQQRYSSLWVGTAEQNHPAISLYQKQGFRYAAIKTVGTPPINWVSYSWRAAS